MRRLLVLLAVCLAHPVPALAQSVPGAVDARTYGTVAKTFLALTPSSFQPSDSTVTYQSNFSTTIGRSISRTNPAGFSSLNAPLQLPDGALVTEIEAVFCDTSTTAGVATALVVQPRLAAFTSFSGPGSSVPESPGCVDRTVVFGTPVQIDNNANSYEVSLSLGAAGSSIQFASLRVGYVLQVSPAPAVATFADVPTSHPYFQFIEALATAGITAGCSASPPLFCPDDPLTRGQAAVLFGKALGLQFAP